MQVLCVWIGRLHRPQWPGGNCTALPFVAGNSTFFFVRRIEDPIALLPNKLILGINKRYACIRKAQPVNAVTMLSAWVLCSCDVHAVPRLHHV